MVVVDTNVIYSGLRSQKGASYLLLDALADEKFEYAISVTLLFEYEDVLKRNIKELWMSEKQIEDFLDSIVSLGNHFSPHFLWRPFLKDPKDDHILELAVASNSDTIITYNLDDFIGTHKFGIKSIKPYEFMHMERLL